jgi:pimeloyl-ACP methyl ester carboxylesterase
VEKIEDDRAEGKDATEPKEYCRVAQEFYKAGLVKRPEALARLQPTIDRVCDYPNEWPINFRKQMAAHFEGSVMKLGVPWFKLKSRVTMPVLTVHGRQDRNAPYGAGREWASKLRDARLLTLDNAAHQSWVDEPDTVVSAIDEFLNGRWSKAAIAIRETRRP